MKFRRNFTGYLSPATSFSSSYAFFKLVVAFRQTDAVVKRNQFKYVIYSSMIGFLLGGTSFFPFFTSLVPPFVAPLVYFYTLPITYAVARYRLMDIDVIIKKSVIYALLLLALLIPCFLVVDFGDKCLRLMRLTTPFLCPLSSCLLLWVFCFRKFDSELKMHWKEFSLRNVSITGKLFFVPAKRWCLSST